MSKSPALAMATTQYTLYYGTFIHTPQLGHLDISTNTLIGVNPSGSIDFVHRNYQAVDNQTPLEFFITKVSPDHPIEFVDFSQDLTKFIIPGFVDTHIHASQYANAGIGLGRPLLDWLKDYTFPLEMQFSSVDFAKDIYTKVISKTLGNGTTCASYFTTIDPNSTNLFGDLLLQHGQRGFVGKVCMDHNEPYPEYEETFEKNVESMKSVIEHLDKINPPGETLVKPIITPRFAPVCSRDMLTYLGELSREKKLPIQTHISENEKEIELVKELFPECRNYADVYHQHKLLNESTILAHAIHLTDEERTLVKQNNCSISHCPTSNTFISSGEAPIKKYLYKDHINVSLGTDVSGGFDSSILGIIKHCILTSHHVSIKSKDTFDQLSIPDAIYMATMGGARAVRLDDSIGTFELGKKFDAQLIDLRSQGSNIDVFDWQVPREKEEKGKKMFDLLGKWVFTGDDRNCVKVWCNGRVVVDKTTHRDDRWILVDKI